MNSKRRQRGGRRKQQTMSSAPNDKTEDQKTYDHNADEPSTTLSETGEERFADALTIIWMLSAVATLAAQMVAGLARALVLFTGEETPQMVARILPGWFLLCSLITGIVCLILTPLAYFVRRTKPPTSIMVTAIL